MIKTSVRRFALALTLGASTLATCGLAHAQSTITGTDPVPKGCGCVVSQPAPNATKTTSPSTATQVVLALLGLA